VTSEENLERKGGGVKKGGFSSRRMLKLRGKVPTGEGATKGREGIACF